jgi:hypothetical protein
VRWYLDLRTIAINRAGFSNACITNHLVSENRHFPGAVPEGIEGCEEFWATRRERLRDRITDVLNAPAG